MQRGAISPYDCAHYSNAAPCDAERRDENLDIGDSRGVAWRRTALHHAALLKCVRDLYILMRNGGSDLRRVASRGAALRRSAIMCLCL